MKKLLIAMIFVTMVLTGCNYDYVDMVYSYDYAWISLPNGEVVEGEVEQWRDYEDGDQIQVKIDGKTYLTDTTRCVLMKEGINWTDENYEEYEDVLEGINEEINDD